MIFVSFSSNMTGITCGAGTVNPPRGHAITPAYSGVRVAKSLIVCVMCLSFFLFAIVLSILLQFIESDYLFAIFKLFLNVCVEYIEIFCHPYLLSCFRSLRVCAYKVLLECKKCLKMSTW